MRKLDEAAKLVESGLERARALGDGETEATMRASKGFVDEHRGDLAATLQDSLESLRLFRQAMHRRGVSHSLQNIGAVYLKLGDALRSQAQVAMARGELSQALQLAERVVQESDDEAREILALWAKQV